MTTHGAGLGDAVEERILELTVAEFARAGIAVRVGRGETGYELEDLAGQFRLYLANLTRAARSADPSEWPGMAAGFASSHLAVTAQPKLEDLTEEEVRHQIRVRLIDDGPSEDDLSYAPGFAPGSSRYSASTPRRRF
jgi:hypothetical protein